MLIFESSLGGVPGESYVPRCKVRLIIEGLRYIQCSLLLKLCNVHQNLNPLTVRHNSLTTYSDMTFKPNLRKIKGGSQQAEKLDYLSV